MPLHVKCITLSRMQTGPDVQLYQPIYFFQFVRVLDDVQVLAGDNKFLCAQCDAKRDTLKRTCIARLPNVLFLHLKRFEFDMEQMRKVQRILGALSFCA